MKGLNFWISSKFSNGYKEMVKHYEDEKGF